MNIKPWLSKDLWWEFLMNEVCGLCGNSGQIASENVVTGRGVVFKRPRMFCICPNGRTMKKQMEKKK